MSSRVSCCIIVLKFVINMPIAYGGPSPIDVPYVKVFDGECNNGSELRMYDGNGDNPGKTAEDKVAACSHACITKRKPLNGKWDDFIPKGFIVNPASGRCHCESWDVFTCELKSNDFYDRYNWISLGRL